MKNVWEVLRMRREIRRCIYLVEHYTHLLELVEAFELYFDSLHGFGRHCKLKICDSVNNR